MNNQSYGSDPIMNEVKINFDKLSVGKEGGIGCQIGGSNVVTP